MPLVLARDHLRLNTYYSCYYHHPKGDFDYNTHPGLYVPALNKRGGGFYPASGPVGMPPPRRMIGPYPRCPATCFGPEPYLAL